MAQKKKLKEVVATLKKKENKDIVGKVARRNGCVP